jgi:hypothetical protein
MCTMIAVTESISGVGKGRDGWFPITQATVGYDHSTHSSEEHALLLDFVNYAIGTGARVALELDLESGRALVAQLQSAIAAAEATGLETARSSSAA